MIYSMTGFARIQKVQALGEITWEIKTVNHRYFDLAIRLPDVFRSWEPAIRQTISKQIERGKIECQLRFVPSETLSQRLSVNKPLIKELMAASDQVVAELAKPMSLNVIDILRWPEVVRSEPMDVTSMEEAVMMGLEEALVSLNAMRQAEGKALAEMILQRLDTMEAHIIALQPQLPHFLTQLREKILKRLADLALEAEPSRLEQEMVFVAQKADIMEEIDRLTTHIQTVRQLITTGGALGRKLDFLMQELNREANTLSSKAIDTVITQTAVELKVLIEQMREQIQNIE